MRSKRGRLGAALALAAGLAVGVSWAIPNCWEICDYGGCEFFCFSWGTHCGSWYQTQINGQSYCIYQCWNGTTGQSICHGDGGGGGGGSPVFRKPNIEQAPSP
ncbi:MAG TPA: hypothetical protein VJS92_14685 [Candidatus Polarisedimenticolaceae bacterium]|nr:hypothetical protein [Candidatus Polarisedimenticolaceae bacterium]